MPRRAFHQHCDMVLGPLRQMAYRRVEGLEKTLQGNKKSHDHAEIDNMAVFADANMVPYSCYRHTNFILILREDSATARINILCFRKTG